MASGENFKAKGWQRVYRRQILLDKLYTEIRNIFYLNWTDPPIGGQTHSSTTSRVVNEKIHGLQLKVDPNNNHNHNHLSGCM